MKSFFLAARPRTLIVSVAPPIASYFYSLQMNSNIAIYLLICAIASSISIQMATNFFNDLIDHQKGSDRVRVGPTRMTASGAVSEKTMKLWAYGSIVSALIFAIPLIYRGGPAILALGLVSLYLSYGYTGGIVSLAYRGLGELFVFLFFGLFSFLGCQYLYLLEIDLTGFLMACQFGSLAVTFIGINNLRDRDLDKKVHKLTLATRMNARSYRGFVIATIFLPYLLHPMIQKGFYPVYLGLVFASVFAKSVSSLNGSDLNKGLKLSGIHLIIFTTLSIIGVVYGSLF